MESSRRTVPYLKGYMEDRVKGLAREFFTAGTEWRQLGATQ